MNAFHTSLFNPNFNKLYSSSLLLKISFMELMCEKDKEQEKNNYLNTTRLICR